MNRHYVRCIQITMAEAFDVQDRGSFYDAVGALRDVVQNHMLQVLSNVMMDAPTGEEHEAQRDQKAALLKAVRPLDAASMVRGQYKGYRSVKGVRPDSTTETYVAVKLFVDSWRWAGVPIYIRAGKCMPLTAAEVTVEFKTPPRSTFGETLDPSANYMRARLSPDVGSAIGLRMKHPGERMTGDNVELSLMQRAGSDMPPYQRLLGDAMRGNNELFGRADTIDAQWRIVEPILTEPSGGAGICARNVGTRGRERAYRRRRPVAESRGGAHQGVNASSCAVQILARRAVRGSRQPASRDRVASRSSPVRPLARDFSRRMVSPSSGRSHELPCVDAGGRGHEPALAIQQLVREGDHPRIRPRLWPRLQQPVRELILAFVRMSLRQDHQRGRRRAGDSRMAVDKQAAGFCGVAAEGQDRFDICFLGQTECLDLARSHRESAASRESVDHRPGKLPDPAIRGRGSTECA